MPAAPKTSQVTVRMILTNAHGDYGIFYGGQEYTVDKKVAEYLLEDPRVAVPVRSSGKTETATEE